MKNIFLIIFSALIVFTQIVIWRELGQNPGKGSPTIYWVTDANPARVEQVRVFQAWLTARKLPPVNLKLDYNNQGPQKTVVQGVTGVAGDLIDASINATYYYRSIGLVEPVTNLEASFGYPDRDVFAPLKGDLIPAEGQICFPCNIALIGLVVNNEAFQKVGLKPPNLRWSFDEFEALGREFTRRANPPGKRQERFFLGCEGAFPLRETLLRSAGVTLFNESYTRATYNQPRAIQVWNRLRRWTAEDHLFPSHAERQSFATEAGYGGPLSQLLAKGHYAMGEGGRWTMIQMRKMKNQTPWSMVLYPDGGWPNAVVGTRGVVLYKGGRQKEVAKSFLGFLRSDEYNLMVVRDSDGLPPNPKFLDSPQYLHPEGFTNEWPLHEATRTMAKLYACPQERSPFVLMANVNREEIQAVEAFMNRLISAEDLCQRIQNSLEKETSRYLRTHPESRRLFEAAESRQKTIDALRAASKNVPLAFIQNPVWRRMEAGKPGAE